jgi:Tfp pilus assembly protein PilW
VSSSQQRGFALLELAIAVALMLLVTASVFSMVNPSQSASSVESEIADMQQRLRVGADVLARDLLMAGAGLYAGARTGSLVYFLPPVLPFRQGATSDDPPGTFRSDRITVLYVPPTTGQTALAQALGPGQTTLQAASESDCAAGVHLCGFAAGETILVVDDTGNYDTFTIASVNDAASQITIASRPADSAAATYPTGSIVVEVRIREYYLKTDPVNQLYELMRYDGSTAADAPVLEHIVGLTFDYFGEPQPAMVTNPGNAHLTTTYGPAPTVGVANCIFTGDQALPAPKLAVLGAGAPTLVTLSAAQLTDGPWCPDAANANRWDADLLRIRKIGVTLRVESALAQLRGPAGVLFANAGASIGGGKWLPDQEIRFQISPRNLNFGR